jgi:hypothetical protein
MTQPTWCQILWYILKPSLTFTLQLLLADFRLIYQYYSSFVNSVKTRLWDAGLSTSVRANNEPLFLLSRNETCGVSLACELA